MTQKSASEIARELGEHIFRWGASCEECTPEDFKIEMKKATRQLKQALISYSQSQAKVLVEGLRQVKEHCQELLWRRVSEKALKTYEEGR